MVQVKNTSVPVKGASIPAETVAARVKNPAKEKPSAIDPARTPARRPGRPVRVAGKAEQRETLLGIALELFAQRGVINTTLVEIARAAGVTAAMVHYYFKSRDHLLDVLIAERLDPIRERMMAALVGTEDPVELLMGLARQMVQISAEHSWYARLWMREVVSEGGGLRDRIDQAHGRSKQEAFIERLRQAQKDGRLNAELEPELIVLSVMGLTLLPLAKFSVSPSPYSPQTASEVIARHAVALLLGGVAGTRA